MKKLIFLSTLAAFILFSCSDDKVTPSEEATFKYKEEQKSAGFFFSGTACEPCGDVGVTTMKSVSAQHGDKFIWLSCQQDVSGSDPYTNIDGTSIRTALNVTTFPSLMLGASGTALQTIEGSTDMETKVNNVVSGHLTKTATANLGVTYTVDDGAIVVEIETEFFEASSDKFYLGAYLIENKLVSNQAYTGGNQSIQLNNILRLKLSADPFGDQLPANAKTKGQIDKMVYGDFLLSSWKLENLRVVAILYTKNAQGKPLIVNASIR